MGYQFYIEKYIYRYNHKITAELNGVEYSCICESAPKKEETILFWSLGFGLDDEGTQELTKDLIEWCEEQDFNYIICEGYGR